MKKKLLLKSLLLLCALVAGSSSVWADNNVSTVSTTFSKTGDVTSNFTQTGDFKNVTWNLGVTWKNGESWQALNSSKGSQIGSGSKPATQIILTGSGISGTITSVKVNTSMASGGAITVGVSVGGTAFSCNSKETATLVTSPTDYDFTGTASGNVVLTWNQSSTSKAIYIKSVTITYSTEDVVAAPTFSPAAGEVAKGTTVTLTQTSADVIKYTLDGSDPSKTTGTVYSNPIVINAATVIKAIAIKGDKVSDVATASYTVPYPKVLTLDLKDAAGWGFPEAYDENEKSYTNKGYTITLGESSNGHKYLVESSIITALIFGKKDATLTLPAFGFNVSKIKVYGNSSASASVTFNIYVGNDAVSTEATSSKVDHEFPIAAAKQTAGTIYTIKVTNANNCQISKIEVFGDGCEAGLVTSFGWATFITTSDVKYPAETAYVVTDASVSAGLTLTEVTQVPSGTPLLLKGEGAKTAISLDTAPDAPATNLLEVSDGSDLASGNYPYVLAKNGDGACFKQWTGAMSTLDGRVVLILNEPIPDGSPALSLDGTTTAIETVEKSTVENGVYYNLSGQRVTQPTKGLYIVNGKKVIMK